MGPTEIDTTSQENVTYMPVNDPQKKKSNAAVAGELKSPATAEYTLTGDVDTDFDSIAKMYKPSELDDNTWRGVWRNIMLQESGGDLTTGESQSPNQKLRKGKRAYGVMQVTPQTGKGLGFSEEELRDPILNFQAGVKNLSTEYAEIGKDKRVTSPEHRLALTFAAYHAGRPNVLASLDRGEDGVPNVDDGSVNTRDYTLNKMKALEEYLATAGKSDLPELLTEEETLAKYGKPTEPPKKADDVEPYKRKPLPERSFLLRQFIGDDPALSTPLERSLSGEGIMLDTEQAPRPASFEEELVELERGTRESLGLIIPRDAPRNFSGKAPKVSFEVFPDGKGGFHVDEEMLSNAVTFALTGDEKLERQFRQEVGEPSGYQNQEITDRWLKDQLAAGNLTLSNPTTPDGKQRFFVSGKIPVMNWVKNRLDAFIRPDGAEEVRRVTRMMDEQSNYYERIAAEASYNQRIAQLRSQADKLENRFAKNRNPEEASELRKQAAMLEAELEARYPVGWLDETYRAVAGGVTGGGMNVLKTGANVKGFVEAPFLSEQEIKEADARDKRLRKLEQELASESLQARTWVGQAAQGLIQEVIYSPMYISGGMMFGPAGGIMTSAMRSADKPLDEALTDIGAAVFEIAGGTLVKGALTAGKGLSPRLEFAINAGTGGLTEAGGEAIIDYMQGKTLDWKKALMNLVIGAGMEVGTGVREAIRNKSRPEGEGEVSFDTASAGAVPFDTEVRSPIIFSKNQDGSPRFGAIIRQGNSVGFMEIPAEHPIMMKHMMQIEAGLASVIGVEPEQFDAALTEWKGTSGEIKLPKMTAEQFKEYVRQVNPNASAEQEENLRQSIKQGVIKDESQTEIREPGQEDDGLLADAQQVEGQVEETAKQPGEQRDSEVLNQPKTYRRYRNIDEALDMDLAKQWDEAEAERDAEIRGAVQGRNDKLDQGPMIKAGVKFSRARQDILAEQKRRDEEREEGKPKTTTTPQPESFKAGRVVKAGGIDIRLPADLAKRWQKVQDDYKAAYETVRDDKNLNLLERQNKSKQLNKQRITEQNRIINEFRQREEETQKRGYLKDSDRPITILEDRGEELTIKVAGEDATRVVKREDIETRKERTLKRKKEPKLPLAVRTKAKFGTFKPGKVGSYASDGIVYINDTARSKIEDALGVEISAGGFNFKPSNLDEALDALRDAGLTKIADQIESQKEASGGRPSLVSVDTEDSGVSLAHERIHEVATDKTLVRSAVERIVAPGGAVDKLVNESEVNLADLDPEDVIQEVLAYGLTGDFETLGVDPDVLYDALLDVIEGYIQSFPDEDLKTIFDRALIDVDTIKSEANRRIKYGAEREQTSESVVRPTGKSAEAGQPGTGEKGASTKVRKESKGSRFGLSRGEGNILNAVLKTISDRPENRKEGPISMSDLRQDVPELSKEQFDGAIEALWNAGDVLLHRHDNPASLSDKQKNDLVQIGENYYVAVTAPDVLKDAATFEDLPKKSFQKFGYQRDVAEPKKSTDRLEVNEELADLSKEYAKINGRGEYNIGEYYDLVPEVYVEIADIANDMKHSPNDPETQKAYGAFMEEIVDQYKFIESKGYVFEPWLQEGQPYADSKAMREDVRNNKHLYFFIGGDFLPDHPTERKSGIIINGYELNFNEAFRVVHDFFGHAVGGAQFGPRGEFNATDSHARMFSWEALPAMLAESTWQNAWVNYGPHIRRPDGTVPKRGDADFVPMTERPYAEQKALNITPDMVDLWLRSYKTPPKDFYERKTNNEKETSELKRKRELDEINRKPAREITRKDIRTIIETGRFAQLSGNTEVGAPTTRSAAKTKALKRELEKMGYKVLDADGVYKPSDVEEEIVEPSVFVVLKSDEDEANMIRLGVRFKQDQVLIGNNGQFRAPFTRNTVRGELGTETRSGKNEALFDSKAIEKQTGKSVVKTATGNIPYAIPDLFADTFTQTTEESQAVANITRAYRRSFKSRAMSNSAALLNWLRNRDAQGKREDLGIRETGEFLVEATEDLYGKPPSESIDDDQDAAMVRRATKDGVAILNHTFKGESKREGDKATGKSWYQKAIEKMHEITGIIFPEIVNLPVLKTLFDLTLAISSPANKVQANYNYAAGLWQRVVEEFGLIETEGKMFPVRRKESKVDPKTGKKKKLQYGRFGPHLEKLNYMSLGYVPVDSAEAKELRAQGADMKRSQAFKNVSGAQQWYVKDPDLEASLKQYGAVAGVIEYLLQPAKGGADRYRATEVLGPKVGAFFMNIAGFSQLVTVDMWASRWFYRINGGLLAKRTKKNKHGIQDSPKTKHDGDLIRGSMQAIANEWNLKNEMQLTPADVQAILWYFEKDVWHSAGSIDSGTIDFATAAENRVQEIATDVNKTEALHQAVVNRWEKEAPKPGPRTDLVGTSEAAEEGRNFYIENMGAGRYGLGHTSRKQAIHNKLRNFDSVEWNKLAERAKGESLDSKEIGKLYNLLQKGYQANTEKQRQNVREEMMDFLNDISSQSLGEFILLLRKAGMLSGIKTTGRNVLSNFAFGVLEEMQRGVAGPIDVINSVLTGQERTVQGWSPVGVARAAAKAMTSGVVKSARTFARGDAGVTFEDINYDPKLRSSWVTGGRPGTAFLNATIGNFAKYVFRFQKAQDVFFREYAYNRAMYEIAALNKKNSGRPIADTLANPSAGEADMAWRMAEVAVFQNDNKLNTAYQRFKGKQPKPIRYLLDYQLPFIKTGSNIFSRTMDYLGVGGVYKVMEMFSQIDDAQYKGAKAKMWAAIDNPESRRLIIEAFSRGFVGLGIATIGFLLASAGFLNGMDDDDPKERNRRIAEGSGPGHLRIGDTWYDIRGVSPVSTILLSGASSWRALNKDMKDESKRWDAMLAVASSIVVDGLPLARAVSDYVNPKSGRSVMQRVIGAGSVVPAIVSEIAATMDDVQRDVKGDTLGENIKKEVQGRLPKTPINPKFNRESLPAKTDVFGRELEEPFIPPVVPFAGALNPKKAKDDKVLKEATDVNWSMTPPKRDTKNNEGRDDFNKRKKKTQELITRVFDAVINDPNYGQSGFSKEERKAILDESAGVARETIKQGGGIDENEMRDIVEAILGKAKDKAEIDKDPGLEKEEKSRAKQSISSKYSRFINPATKE